MANMLSHYNPEYVVCFDVDETLCKVVNDTIVIHEKHVEALKAHWYRGHHVIVWSAGGEKWAAHIMNKLKLHNYVHEVKSKPKWYVDDLPADEWMDRYYIKKEGFNNGHTVGTNKEADRGTEISSTISFITFGGGSLVYPVPEIQSSGPIVRKDTD